jgi:hypothetical protein
VLSPSHELEVLGKLLVRCAALVPCPTVCAMIDNLEASIGDGRVNLPQGGVTSVVLWGDVTTATD